MIASLEGLLGLEGRVALVTGGGNGIARATALQLAVAGCDVAVVDRDLEAAEHTTDDIRALGRKAVAIQADITDPTAPAAMVEEAVAALGPISVAVDRSPRS